MKKVKILIDSASDITVAEGKEMGVTVLPMQILFNDEEYFDGETLSAVAFYEKLIENTEPPKTSLINQFRWEEAISSALKEAEKVVVITMSSKLSGTYAEAKRASESFKDKVFVVDSYTVATAERLLCQYALRLVDEGKTAEEIFNALEKKKKDVYIIAVISSLEYLKKGGRISPTVAFAGSMLSIKPVVSAVDGKVKVIGKAMGSKNGKNLLNKMVLEKGGIDFSMPFGALWSGLDRTTLNKYIQDSAPLWAEHADNVPAYIVGCTIGTHVGPGAVGVAFFCNENNK